MALGGERALINRSGFSFRRAPFARKLGAEMQSSAALLRYELALFVRSFADAFNRKRDRLLLAIVLCLALLWMRQGVGAAGEPPRGLELLALAAAPVSFSWNRLVGRRLDWLAEESALASCAARPAARLRYRLAAQFPILVPILFAAAIAGPAATGLAIAAFGVGALAAPVRWGPGRRGLQRGRKVRPPLSGPHTALMALLRVQALDSARPGRALVFLFAANFLLTFAGSFLTRGAVPHAHLAATALPSLLMLAATARNDARLTGFLAFAGYSAGFVALAVSAVPAASFAAASAAALAGGAAAPVFTIVALALLHLGAALIAVARAWLSPGRDGRKVDFQVQVEAVGLLVLGLMLPPLAIPAIAARLWMLRTGYRASIGLQP